jgi:hypothetical protein
MLVRTMAGRGSSHRQQRLAELLRSVRRHRKGQRCLADAQISPALVWPSPTESRGSGDAFSATVAGRPPVPAGQFPN